LLTILNTLKMTENSLLIFGWVDYFFAFLVKCNGKMKRKR